MQAGSPRPHFFKMELVLSEVDLDRMPAELRHQLFLYLGQKMGPHEGDTAEGAPLAREHVVAALNRIAATRGVLRELLAAMKASGKNEEPP
jgi:hypothetical protein